MVSSESLSLSPEERQQLGLRAADGLLYQQDKVWSRYSNDKVDIAGTLARVLRTLSKALPLDQPLTAFSIGSSNEPQFRLLESFFRVRFVSAVRRSSPFMDLEECVGELRQDPRLDDAQVLSKRSRVEFFVDDFGQFMAVVWMILLHPDVHRFSSSQQQEVIEFVYEQLWSRRRPLVQQ